MTFFKNRKTAILIAVVIAVLSTLLGAGRGLNRLTNKIEAMFYDGVYMESDRYTQPGIAPQLDRYADATIGLATIMISYSDLRDGAEDILTLRRDLIDAESISDKSLAFWMLSRYVYNLIQAASEYELSQRDREAVSQYASTIEGAEEFIRNAAYNEEAARLWSERSFISRLLTPLIPVREPESF